ncbi:retron St85 family RNA-directed DNA polymerase [Peribacillus frigoritolerans]|uniref:retron St85 family RNA-directed DNA polymerase n=1 Tax=Peribacillus frigoritolerans TaxID=450367 RepID=UPI00207AD17B|nr:retron St85 family RNA-directed DNA polymerase [Peribacillus frigoritolerans]USK64044.1 retron St85 family RNA-directed DNA polymerase [Peribacillus frigoritolerans]
MSNRTNSFILNALNLPLIKDIESLANHIGISNKLLYQLSSNTKMFYTSFTLPKKDGTTRIIQSPKYPMKLVQRWILEEILQKIPVSNHSTAFQKGKNGIKENADFHKYSIYLLQMDLKDFFPSISSSKVFNIFRKLGYDNFISNILTKLCTFNGALPQGGVCSPYISNLVCYKLDNRFNGLCSTRDVLYTRYADDLTFSADNKETLKKIKNVIEEIIIDEGFGLNRKKTRFLSPYSHKVITGITINDYDKKLKVKKEIKRNLRALIHFTISTGDYSHVNKINGYVSFINSIEQGYREKIINYINKLIDKDSKYFDYLVNTFNASPPLKGVNSMEHEECTLSEEEERLYEIPSEIYFFENVVREKIDYFKNQNIELPRFLKRYESLYGREVAAFKNEDDLNDDDTIFF